MARTSPIRLRTVAATIVVVASGLIIFNVYQSIINSGDETPQALPIIQADSTPFRVLPEDPGGAKIPGQGSTLFNVIDNDQSDPLALAGADLSPDEPTTINEELNTGSQGFELPEAPEPRTESLYGMIEDLKERDSKPEGVVETEREIQAVASEKATEPLTNDAREELQDKLADVIVRAETIAKDDALIEKTLGEKGVMTVEIPTPSNKPSVPQKTVVKQTTQIVERAVQADAPKQYYIQLASLRDEAAARTAYERIRDDFPNLVSGLNVVFPKVDLGSRGTFTRIQVGPLPQAQAKKRCADYSAAVRGGTCLVINR